MAPPHAPGEDLKLGAHAPIALSKTEDVRNIIVPGTTPIVSNQPVNDDITSNRGFHILQAEPLP